MPVEAPAPPTAPAAPPTPPPPPSRTAPPPTPDRQDSPDAGWLQEAGNELEQLDRDTNQPRPPRPAQGMPRKKPDAPQPPVEPKEEQQPAAQEDDVINPGDEPERPPQPANQPPERPMRAPELRKAYEETKAKLTEREQAYSRMEARIKELEGAGPKDTEQTTQKLQQLEARNKQMEDFLRLKHYEQSQEYNEKFKVPYEKAWERCLRDISQLEVEVSDGRGGYTTRKATDADITYLASLPLGELIKQSNAMFGDAGDVVRKHVEKINETYQAQSEAIEQAQKRSVELSQTEQKRREEEGRVREKLWTDNNAELATKYPSYFAPIQGDESGNKLLDAGFAFTDLLFSNNVTPDKLALLPPKFRQEIETKGKLSPELTVRAHAIIRNKAANHDRLARQLKAARAELEEVRKKLNGYEESEPSVGGSVPERGGAPGGHWSEEAYSELDELSRKGPQ